jgi:hypothetical protein
MTTDQQSTDRLSSEEITALKFAAHRQLARWSNKHALSLHQQAQRNALRNAVRILENNALARGCELHATGGNGNHHAR